MVYRSLPETEFKPEEAGDMSSGNFDWRVDPKLPEEKLESSMPSSLPKAGSSPSSTPELLKDDLHSIQEHSTVSFPFPFLGFRIWQGTSNKRY